MEKFFRFLGKFPANFISPANNYDCFRTLTYFSSIFVWRFNDQHCHHFTNLRDQTEQMDDNFFLIGKQYNFTAPQFSSREIDYGMGNLPMIYL